MSQQPLPDSTPDFYSLAKRPNAPPEPMDFYAIARPQPIQKVPEPSAQPLEQSQEKPSVEDNTIAKRAKDYFTQGKLGEAVNLQMRSGGFAGAPVLEPKPAKMVATEVGTYAAVEAAFAPLYGVVAAAKYAPRVLRAITRLTESGTKGVATATTSKLADVGELPTQEELVKNGAEWIAIDALMQALHLGTRAGKTSYDFGKAVNDISKKDNIPRTQVLSKLWDSTKGFIKQKFGKNIVKPEDIKVKDVEALIEKTKQAEKEGLGAVAEVVPEVEKLAIPEVVKPVIEKPKVLDFENIDDVNQMISNAEKKIQDFEKSDRKNAQEAQSIEALKKTLPALYEIRTQIQETGKPEYLEPEKPVSGYERKPKPETVDEKITHLTGKVKESESYIASLKDSIKEQKSLVMSLEGSKDKEALKKYRMSQVHLEEKKYGLESEKDYLRRLKADLRDIKTKREGSKVEVPLGVSKNPKPSKKKIRPEGYPTSFVFKQPKMGKKQAAKRSDILKLFRKAFNDPIRLGKISQRDAAGIHKLWGKVTRLLRDNDIESASHEIGHNLHTILYGGNANNPTQQRVNINKALHPYLGELKPLALYEPWGMEGFAEFTRMYVTNPEAARALAPKFYAKFENDLDSRFPELKNALLEAREYYDTYLEGTPESRIDAQLNFAQDEGKLKSMVDWVKEGLNLDKLKTEFLDDVFPAKRLVAEAFGIPLTEVESLTDERNLYRSLRVLKGAVGKGDVFLRYETFDPDTLEKTGEGLRDILKELPDEDSYREFNRFLVARRAIEKHAQSIDTGINQGDAVQVYDQYKDQYGDLAKRLDSYNDQLLLYAHKSGLLSSDQYKAIKKNNMAYAPFQRVMTPEKNTGVQATSGKIQAGKPIKRMKGSTRDIIAPIESVIKNTYTIIINAEKNRAGQVLGKIANMQNVGKYVERVPTPIIVKSKLTKSEVHEQIVKHLTQMAGETQAQMMATKIWEFLPDGFLRFGAGTYPAGENIVTVFYDGKPTYFEVSPEIYEMWNKGMAPYTANILTKILRAPARLLRAGAILNPKFIQKNFIRDTWGSWLFTKYGKSIRDPVGLFIDTMYQPLAMLAQATKKGPLYVEWLKSGGGMSTMQSLDRQSVLKHIEEVKKNFKPYQIMKMLRAVAEISEEANRLLEFAKALDFHGSSRLGREIAAFAARDLSIDFAKMGLQTKALNQIIPFFNATIQGGDKLVRTLADPKARKEFIPRAIGFILIPSLILAWLNQDDDEVKELQEQEKDFNFVTKIGKKILKIPVPFETGVLIHGLTQRMYRYFIDKDSEAFEGFMGSILDATLPTFIPSFANPFIEAQANKNFFTGRRIIPGSQEKLTSKYQYKTYTSLTARLLGRAMNYMLGEDTTSKAASPAVIDHFITSWTGGLGRMMVNISDAALEKAGYGDKIPRPEQTVVEKLGLDAFIARYPRANTRSIEKFYDNYQDAMSRVSSKDYAKKQNLETDEELQKSEERIEKIYDVHTLKRAYKSIQMCQREINNIMIDPEITSEEKRELVDQLYLQMIQFAKAANEDIQKYRLDQAKP